eukprot:RCo010463
MDDGGAAGLALDVRQATISAERHSSRPDVRDEHLACLLRALNRASGSSRGGGRDQAPSSSFHHDTHYPSHVHLHYTGLHGGVGDPDSDPHSRPPMSSSIHEMLQGIPHVADPAGLGLRSDEAPDSGSGRFMSERSLGAAGLPLARNSSAQLRQSTRPPVPLARAEVDPSKALEQRLQRYRQFQHPPLPSHRGAAAAAAMVGLGGGDRKSAG